MMIDNVFLTSFMGAWDEVLHPGWLDILRYPRHPAERFHFAPIEDEL